jgi:hypothetical protein
MPLPRQSRPPGNEAFTIPESQIGDHNVKHDERGGEPQPENNEREEPQDGPEVRQAFVRRVRVAWGICRQMHRGVCHTEIAIRAENGRRCKDSEQDVTDTGANSIHDCIATNVIAKINIDQVTSQISRPT